MWPAIRAGRTYRHVTNTAKWTLAASLLTSFLIEPDPMFPLSSHESDLPDYVNARAAFADRSTPSLLRSLLVYKYATFPTLVSMTPSLLDLARTLRVDWMVYPIVKWTAFAQFCGGETCEEARQTLEELHKRGISGILDLSIEADIGHAGRSFEQDKEAVLAGMVEYWEQHRGKLNARADHVAEMIADGIRAARQVEGSFVAVKATAIVADPEVLEKWSAALGKAHADFVGLVGEESEVVFDTDVLLARETGRTVTLEQFKALARPYLSEQGQGVEKRLDKLFMELDRTGRNQLDWIDYVAMFQPDVLRRYDIHLLPSELQPVHKSDLLVTGDDVYRHLHPSTQQEILKGLERLKFLGSVASCVSCRSGDKDEYPVRIMIDAEQSYLQPAIAYMTQVLSTDFNASQEPVIYGTYQLYKRTALTELVDDVEDARRDKRIWAGKLVRGAYVVQERKRAEERKTLSAVWDSKHETDLAYDAGADLVIQEAFKESSSGTRAMLATHNHASTSRAIRWLKSLTDDGDPNSLGVKSKILFGQLHGMGEIMSTELLRQGYSVAKYIPYGQVSEVIPYLVRRAEENGAVLGEFGQNKEIVGSGGGEDRRGMMRVLRERFGWKSWVGLRSTS
jgi:proline dehydrogenase